eukprot:1504513-Amphidinium_carterae.1
MKMYNIKRQYVLLGRYTCILFRMFVIDSARQLQDKTGCQLQSPDILKWHFQSILMDFVSQSIQLSIVAP